MFTRALIKVGANIEALQGRFPHTFCGDGIHRWRPMSSYSLMLELMSTRGTCSEKASQHCGTQPTEGLSIVCTLIEANA